MASSCWSASAGCGLECIIRCDEDFFVVLKRVQLPCVLVIVGGSASLIVDTGKVYKQAGLCHFCVD